MNNLVRKLVASFAVLIVFYDNSVVSAFTTTTITPRLGLSTLAIKLDLRSSSTKEFSRRDGGRYRFAIYAVVDPLENSTDRPVISNHGVAETERGSKPPFPVTLETEDGESYSRAIERTLAWVGAACAFGAGLSAFYGTEISEEFFAGYLLEQSLSIDNLFVFLLLFEYFKVPSQYQDRVLNWGIYGAIVMRAIMIILGAAAVAEFHQILLVFAAILLFSSFSFFLGKDEEENDNFGENLIVKLSKSLINSTENYDGDRFFTTENDGIRKATPMLICMIAIEISDVVFAVDSIPAVFGVTENALVVFTSNMFAIAGLRSLYTILSKAASDLKYLDSAAALVLGFIGSKMVAEYFGVHIPTEYALAVVASLLTIGVGASIVEKRRHLMS